MHCNGDDSVVFLSTVNIFGKLLSAAYLVFCSRIINAFLSRAGANGPAGKVLAWPLFTRCTPSFSNCLGLVFVTKPLERNAVVINTIFERKFSSQCFICFVLLKLLISKCNLLGMAIAMARQPSLAWPDRFFRFYLERRKPQHRKNAVYIRI